jgi:hypothetical protein
MPSGTYLMLRSARRARLEARATVMQLFAHFHTLFLGNDGAKPMYSEPDRQGEPKYSPMKVW